MSQDLPLNSHTETAQTNNSPLNSKLLKEIDPVYLLHTKWLQKILKKFPQSFDLDTILELNRCIAIPTIEFKRQRSARHILKIAYAHYFTQQTIVRGSKIEPEKRHLRLHTIRAEMHFPFGKKNVLGLMIGFCLKEKYEYLEENHIFQSVLKYIPGIRLVQRSFYSHHNSYENTRFVYAELEKIDNSPFSTAEVSLLKCLLPQDLESRIERLVPSLFLTHNEEEVMKSILMLSRELHYVGDIPQVMISFEEQSYSELIFSVIIVRVLRKRVDPEQSFSPLSFGEQAKCINIRTERIGYLRKKYPKEAILLRLQIPKASGFLRTDSSINLYLARHKVASLIRQKIGEFRDFNGGLILKRLELISELKEIFKEAVDKYPDLIEDIFYSINPIEMQAVLSLQSLRILLTLFLDLVQQPFSGDKSYSFKEQQEDLEIFMVIQAKDPSLEEYLHLLLERKGSAIRAAIISTVVSFRGTINIGYIYQEPCLKKRKKFVQLIKQGLEKWHLKLQNAQVLRISVLSLPISLDPRLGGDENSGNILRMLYEGLMRIGADGVPTYGIAQSVNISSNFKQYIFKLRNADWSNGMRISAYDFEYAWKKILSPHFKTTFAYLFYPIKNAKLAKKGLLPLDAVGVKAVDHKTLKVDLETPTPYFLELTAHTIYSPINQTIDQSYPDWPMLDSESYVCNGPFQIEKHSPGHGYELRRNENYWEKDTVKLSKISVFKTTPYTAAKMYQKHEIDWIGAPLRPWESFFSHCQTQDPIQISTVSRALYWYAINTTLFPFNNLKVRQALAYAINRKKIIDTLLYDGLPALTPLPLIHTLNQQIKSLDQNEKKAEELFKEALQELGLQKDQFPVFTLIHINREMKRKVAKLIQQQWKEVLGIHCRLECYEWKELFLKMTQGDYQVGGMSWAARIDDPLYTLDVFADMENQFNFTKWEHIEFAKSLKKARKEICPKQQLQFLAQAERILTEQFPVIPLFYELERYKRKDYLKNVQLSRVGNIDFKSAYIFKDLKKVDY